MKEHLSTTMNEVVARLNKKWDEDVSAFDEVYSRQVRRLRPRYAQKNGRA
jgi:hypothetical protein